MLAYLVELGCSFRVGRGRAPRARERDSRETDKFPDESAIMNVQELPRVLCVDDEPRVVDSLALHLRRDYQVLTAHGGTERSAAHQGEGRPRR